ncbi:MAG: hypothetical protein WC519_02955 [Parcubacteria group bacterium]
MNRIKGQILNEALIAIGVMTVGVLGMTGFLSRSISEGRYIADQTTAVNLAAEGIEIAKNILDGNALSGDGAWNKDFNIEGFFEVDYKSAGLGDSVGETENQNVLKTLKKEQVGDAEFYSYSGAIGTTFKRSVQIDYVTSYQIRATARVYWTAKSGRLNNVSLSSDFYYWR